MRLPALFTVILLAGCVTPTLPGTGGGDTPAFALDCGISNWADPCTALSSPNDSPSKAEIDLVVDPKDPLHVVVASKDLDKKASDCVWAVAQVTRDGGKTWKTTYVGGDAANREPMLEPFRCITDPIMMFDANGVLYYALQAYQHKAPGVPDPTGTGVVGVPAGGSTFILARSKDGGDTFDKFVLQHVADGTLVFHDYPRMLYMPKTKSVHTIWNGVGSAGITPWVSTTRDGGETVDPPVTFYAQDAPRGTGFESGFAATSDGQIFVTIGKTTTDEFVMGTSPATKTLYLFRSTDDARSFEEVGKIADTVPTPRQVEGHAFRTPSFMEMAIDTTAGSYQDRIYVFWPDYATNDSDIMSSTSSDRGKTWSAPVRVNVNATDDQFIMRPKVGADGVVHVLYYTQEYDPEGKLLDAIHAWSADGGATWKNQRLTATSFDGDLGIHQSGVPFIGDYNGIDIASDGTIYMAWADTRTGRAEIAFARLVPAS
jgi:hypothetical protein